MGWLSGWRYRKSHVINGSTAGAQTNYQIRVKVHRTAGTDSGEDVYVGTKCRADFGDIRFTRSDGETLLDYWFENQETAEADGYGIFWVKVDSIPASPDTAAIYIYYGNPSAVTASNGLATWIIYHDFEGDAVGGLPLGWGSYMNKGHFVVSTDYAFEGAKSVKLYDTETNDSYGGIRGLGGRYAGGKVLCRLKQTAGDYVISMYLGSSTGSSWGTSLAGLTRPTYSTWEWYLGCWYNGVFRLKDKDGEVSKSYSGTPGQFMYYSSLAHVKTQYIDVVCFGKYVEPEPSHGAWGSEETPGVAHEVTVAEKLGLVDGVARRVDYGTLVCGAEKLGLIDSVTPKWSAHVTAAEKLGFIDAVAKVKAAHVAVAEKLGMVDGVLKKTAYRMAAAEKLGLLDAARRVRGACVTVAEKLGFIDREKERKIRIEDLPDHTRRGGA